MSLRNRNLHQAGKRSRSAKRPVARMPSADRDFDRTGREIAIGHGIAKTGRARCIPTRQQSPRVARHGTLLHAKSAIHIQPITKRAAFIGALPCPYEGKWSAHERIRTLPAGGENALADGLSQVNARQAFFEIPITDTKCWQKCHVLPRFRAAALGFLQGWSSE